MNRIVLLSLLLSVPALCATITPSVPNVVGKCGPGEYLSGDNTCDTLASGPHTTPNDDAQDAAVAVDTTTLRTDVNAKVSKAGDTMTGQLTNTSSMTVLSGMSLGGALTLTDEFATIFSSGGTFDGGLIDIILQDVQIAGGIGGSFSILPGGDGGIGSSGTINLAWGGGSQINPKGRVGIGMQPLTNILEVEGAASFGAGSTKSTFTAAGLLRVGGGSINLNAEFPTITTSGGITDGAGIDFFLENAPSGSGGNGGSIIIAPGLGDGGGGTGAISLAFSGAGPKGRVGIGKFPDTDRLEVDGNANFNSSVTASAFFGDGNKLTNVRPFFSGKNKDGSTINRCEAVYISGGSGPNINIKKAKGDSDITTHVAGLITSDSCLNDTTCEVTALGLAIDCDTTAFAVGNILHLSTVTSGELQFGHIVGPGFDFIVGTVLRVDVNKGSIFVSPHSHLTVGLGTANQIRGMDSAAENEEYKTFLGTSGEIDLTFSTAAVEFGLAENLKISTPTGNVLTISSGSTASQKLWIFEATGDLLPGTFAQQNIGSASAPLGDLFISSASIKFVDPFGNVISSLSVNDAGDLVFGAFPITNSNGEITTGALDPDGDLLLQESGGNVGVGTNDSRSILHIKGNTPGTVGSAPAGQIIIQALGTDTNGNAVIIGCVSDGAGGCGEHLWYWGSSSSGNKAVTLLNRQNDKLTLGTNGLTRLTVAANGDVGIGIASPGAKLDIAGNIKIADGTQDAGKVLISDAAGLASWSTVSSAGLSAGAVTAAKLGTGAVITTKIGDGAINTAKLLDSAVTTVKLADGSVTTAKLHSEALDPAGNLLLQASGGNVGIGTTNPAEQLDISNATGGILRLTSSDTSIVAANELIGKLEFFTSDTSGNLPAVIGSIRVDSNDLFDGTGTNGGDMVFATYVESAGLVDRLTITADGNVGIGTASPEAPLHVVGDSTITADAFTGGFTELGTGAPKIKMKKLTGTTGATEGDVVSVAHGLTLAKIIGIQVLVTADNGNLIPPAFDTVAEFEYGVFIDPTNVKVDLSATNSGTLLSNAFTVLLTYEE